MTEDPILLVEGRALLKGHNPMSEMYHDRSRIITTNILSLQKAKDF
jgi:hypothetical protein